MHSAFTKKHSHGSAPICQERWEGEKLVEPILVILWCQQRRTTKYWFIMFLWSLLTATLACSQSLVKKKKSITYAKHYQSCINNQRCCQCSPQIALCLKSVISPSLHYISHIHQPQPTHLLPPSSHKLLNCKLKLCGVVCKRGNCVDGQRPLKELCFRTHDP